MFEEKENEEQNEIEELKTFTIADYVKMRREQRKQDQAEFEAKLKVLQEKTDRLKRELGYKDRNQKNLRMKRFEGFFFFLCSLRDNSIFETYLQTKTLLASCRLKEPSALLVPLSSL
ncbi:hypothetical protein BCM0079_1746 [Bacillus cereus]|uniref:hypothetical protein n=1 Tax=Bacillus cereus TaxID=1396 RepID=UPI001F3B034C|nr:hypothetical protein [Bacillus cereus]BCC23153.1 hypothetical protein BCM0079_1746 [Bacillus cereus]